MNAPQLSPAARRREIDRLAGQVPDTQLARLVGCSLSIVVRRRRVLRRPSVVRPGRPRVIITREQLEAAGAGTVPDRVLAERLGCGIASAALARRIAGIREYRVSDASYKAALLDGEGTDAEIAARFGVRIGTVRTMRNRLGVPRIEPDRTPPWVSMLGTMPDYVVAERGGTHRNVVNRWRARLKIPAYVGRTPCGCGGQGVARCGACAGTGWPVSGRSPELGGKP